MRIDELTSTKIYPYEKINDVKGGVDYEFNADSIKYIIVFENTSSNEFNNAYEISFHTEDGSIDEFNPDWKKKKIFQIFGTIEAITKDFLDHVKPDYLVWGATGKRRDIYRRFKHPKYNFFNTTALPFNDETGEIGASEGLNRK